MTSKIISEKEFVCADKIPRYRASIQIRSLCLVSAKSPYRLGLIKIIALVYSKKHQKRLNSTALSAVFIRYKLISTGSGYGGWKCGLIEKQEKEKEKQESLPNELNDK